MRHIAFVPLCLVLTCQQWSDPAFGQRLGIREIRTALGDIFALHLPDAAPDDYR